MAIDDDWVVKGKANSTSSRFLSSFPLKDGWHYLTPKIVDEYYALLNGRLTLCDELVCKGEWNQARMDIFKRHVLNGKGYNDVPALVESVDMSQVTLLANCTMETISRGDASGELVIYTKAYGAQFILDSLFYSPYTHLNKLKSVDLPTKYRVDYSRNHRNSAPKHCDSVLYMGMKYIFANCTSLERVDGLSSGIDKFIMTLDHAFYHCSSLKTVAIVQSPYADYDMSQGLRRQFFSMKSACEGCSSLMGFVMENMTSFECDKVSLMRYYCDNYEGIKATDFRNAFKDCPKLGSVAFYTEDPWSDFTNYKQIPDSLLAGTFDGSDQCVKYVAGSLSSGIPSVWKAKYNNFAITDVTYSFLSLENSKVISSYLGYQSYLSGNYRLSFSPSYAYHKTSLKAIDFEMNQVYDNDMLTPTEFCVDVPVTNEAGSVIDFRRKCEIKPAGHITKELNNGYLVLTLDYHKNRVTDSLLIINRFSPDIYVTYVDGDKIVRIDTAQYGEDLPTPPVLNAVYENDYVKRFVGWSDTVAQAKDNIVIQAKRMYDYKIWICGVPVTEENIDTLVKIRKSNGTRVFAYSNSCRIEFSPETRTLTLDGGSSMLKLQTGNGSPAIQSAINGLKVKIIGEVDLVTPTAKAIISELSMSIIGSGKEDVREDLLKIYDGGEAPIFEYFDTLTIKDCYVLAYGTAGVTTPHLVVDNAVLIASSLGIPDLTNPNFVKCESLDLKGVRFSKPQGAYFSPSLYGVTADGKTLTDMDFEIVPITPSHTVTYMSDGKEVSSEVVYEGDYFTPMELPNDTTSSYYKIFDGWDADMTDITSDTTLVAKWKYKYKLRVAGVYVTDENGDDLTIITGVLKNSGDAYLRFDASSNTLEMRNVTITTPDVTWGIFNEIENLTIDMSGYNTVYTPNCIAIRGDRNMKVVGTLNDTLVVKNDAPVKGVNAYAAFHMMNSSALTIDNCAIVVSGAAGIGGELVLRNAYLSAQSEGTVYNDNYRKVMYSVKDCPFIKLYASKLVQPENAEFSSTLKGITTDGTSLTRSQVVFEPTNEKHSVSYMVAGEKVMADTFYAGEKISKKRLLGDEVSRDGKYYLFYKGWDKDPYNTIIKEDIVVNAVWDTVYNLIVAGSYVSDDHLDDIAEWVYEQYNPQDTQHAVIAYDPTENVLSIDVKRTSLNRDYYYYGVVEDWKGYSGSFIENGIPNLTIRISGKMLFESDCYHAVYSKTPITIEGIGIDSSAITLRSNKNHGQWVEKDTLYAALKVDGNVSVKNCSVAIEAPMGCETEAMILEGALFSSVVKGNLKDGQDSLTHSFANCASLKLDSMEIIAPVGAYYDETLKGITVDGVTLTKDSVVISPKAPAVITASDDHSVAQLTFYPNPAQDYLYVSGTEDVEAFVYDAMGCLQLATQIENGKVDVRPLMNGLYFIQIEDGIYKFYVRR